MPDTTVPTSPHIRATGCSAGAFRVQLIPRDRTVEVLVTTASVVGQRVDELTASFATPTVARLVARHLTLALRAHFTTGHARLLVSAAAQQMLKAIMSAPVRDDVLAADAQRAIDVYTPAVTAAVA